MTRIMYCCLMLVCGLLVCGCDYEPDGAVLEREAYDCGVRLAAASAVVCGDSLYVFFGRDDLDSMTYVAHYSDRFYVMPMSDLSKVLTRKLPVHARSKGVAVVLDEKVYLGLGSSGKVYTDSVYLNDFWRYDPKTGRWERLSDAPARDVNGAVVWSADASVYTAFGYSDGFNKNVYRYDIEMDEWSRIADDSADIHRRAFAYGACVGGRFFAGGGFNTRMVNEWVEFDPDNGGWKRLAAPPDRGRINASAVAAGRSVYLVGGRYWGGTETTEFFYNTLLRYDVDSDRWIAVGRFKDSAVENCIAFSYRGDLYYGLGQRRDGTFEENIYKVEF